MRQFPGTLQALGVGLGVLVAITLPLRAAERVTLKNGFEVTCDHQQQMNGKVRLYTQPGEDDFFDVDAADILSVEAVPDPPVAVVLPPSARLSSAHLRSAHLSSAQSALTKTDLNELLAKAGAERNLDADLLASVVRAESGGNPRAVSHAGAQGLMQLMPQTASQLGVSDSFRPDQNIRGGASYLDALLMLYHGNLALALAAYNAGPAAVDRYHGVPPYPETRVYVARVIREFNRRKKAENLARNAAAHHSAAVRPAE